ncbi:hypothetical protein [Oscillatoria sp. HE19RPO]|nr:hypothetical protein [Oscillatoria sp. HE19RPO]
MTRVLIAIAPGESWRRSPLHLSPFPSLVFCSIAGLVRIMSMLQNS